MGGEGLLEAVLEELAVGHEGAVQGWEGEAVIPDAVEDPGVQGFLFGVQRLLDEGDDGGVPVDEGAVGVEGDEGGLGVLELGHSGGLRGWFLWGGSGTLAHAEWYKPVWIAPFTRFAYGFAGRVDPLRWDQ